jgi:outer membrane immunogenic protein
MRKFAFLLAFLVSSTSVSFAGADWTGFYVGAHGGFTWVDTDYPGLNPYIAPPNPCGDCGPPRPNLESGIVGGQIGYNFQFDNVVVGGEADLSFAGIDETVRDGNYITQTHTINHFGSIRGKLGLAFDRFLPYVTGGWAWADMEYSQMCPDPAAVPFGHCSPTATGGPYAPYNKSDSQTETGWVIGGGFAYMIDNNWSIKTEYLRYDFGSQGYDLGKTPSGKDLGVKTLEHEMDVFKIAVDLKLF